MGKRHMVWLPSVLVEAIDTRRGEGESRQDVLEAALLTRKSWLLNSYCEGKAGRGPGLPPSDRQVILRPWIYETMDFLRSEAKAAGLARTGPQVLAEALGFDTNNTKALEENR